MAKKEFQAESRRLLELMINSIYTHQEIFLRELISNASDAIDKLCFRSLTDENVGMERGDFFIRIKGDKENGTLTISDNGIGMTAEEMESNLGVIAKSGSLAFKKDLDAAEKDKADIDVIGQFGVGFYSAFMVASKNFYKPISCHLYPIRVGNYGLYKAVNYHRWDVCKAAILLGQKENLPVYKFLKEPLIRKFGEDWYAELELVVEEMKKQGIL